MSEPSVTVTPCRGSGFTFDVIVRDLRGESRHRATIEANEAERWAKLGAAPSRCVEAVMRFLLDTFRSSTMRSPATSPSSAANRGAEHSRRPKYGGMLS